jgi:hypothetical protein
MVSLHGDDGGTNALRDHLQMVAQDDGPRSPLRQDGALRGGQAGGRVCAVRPLDEAELRYCFTDTVTGNREKVVACSIG